MKDNFNPTMKAIDELLVRDIEFGRQIVRKCRLDNAINSKFSLKSSAPITELSEKNGKPEYRKITFGTGTLFIIKSLYVGKKGDVIFSFSTPSNGSDGKVTSPPSLDEGGELRMGSAKKIVQYEMKMEDALKNLLGFSDFLESAFHDHAKERKEHFELMEFQAEERKRQLIEDAKNAELARQAKKYEGNAARGAW